MTDIIDVDEKRRNFINPFGYSDESMTLYNQALQCARSNNLKDFESYLKQSIEIGHLGAAYTLGNYYYLTLGEKEKALEWYEFAHNKGYPGMKQILDNLIEEINAHAIENKFQEAQKNSNNFKHKRKINKAKKENKKFAKKIQNEKPFKKSSNEKFFDRIKPYP